MSDTHGDLWAARDAVRVFEDRRVQVVLHCGDVGPGVMHELRGFIAHFVRGNTDSEEGLRQALCSEQQTFHGHLGELEFAGRKIAFLHGDDERALRDLISSQKWDLICHGHSHKESRTVCGRTLVLNPGALHRTSAPSVAIVKVPEMSVEVVPL
ncbi:MAG: YfcE family phosphodiesterase [Pirellulales bacterium]|nr:YfcE family phosphodiesterase [Pirellulales bacterium]